MNRKFSDMITICSITVFIFNKKLSEMNILRINKIKILKIKFLQKLEVFLQYGKDGKTRGATFREGSTIQRVLLTLGSLYKSI